MINLDPARGIDPVKAPKSGDTQMTEQSDGPDTSFSSEIEKNKSDEAEMPKFARRLPEVPNGDGLVLKSTSPEPLKTIEASKNIVEKLSLEPPLDNEIATEKVPEQTPMTLESASLPAEVFVENEQSSGEKVLPSAPEDQARDNLNRKATVIDPEVEQLVAETPMPQEKAKSDLSAAMPIQPKTGNEIEVVDAKPQTPLGISQAPERPEDKLHLVNTAFQTPDKPIDNTSEINQILKPKDAPKPALEKTDTPQLIAPPTRVTAQKTEAIGFIANDQLETIKMSDIPIPKDRVHLTQPLQAQPAAQSVTPKDIMRQISGALARPIDNGIEVRLRPAELGRIVLHIIEVSGQQTVTVSADTKEVVDLLKRHETLLETELKDAGYDSPSFLFSEHEQSDEMPPDSEFAPQTDAKLGDFVEVGAMDVTANRSNNTSRLDIRL